MKKTVADVLFSRRPRGRSRRPKSRLVSSSAARGPTHGAAEGRCPRRSSLQGTNGLGLFASLPLSRLPARSTPPSLAPSPLLPSDPPSPHLSPSSPLPPSRCGLADQTPASRPALPRASLRASPHASPHAYPYSSSHASPPNSPHIFCSQQAPHSACVPAGALEADSGGAWRPVKRSVEKGVAYKIYSQSFWAGRATADDICIPLHVSKAVFGTSLSRKKGWVTWYDSRTHRLAATSIFQWVAESRALFLLSLQDAEAGSKARGAARQKAASLLRTVGEEDEEALEGGQPEEAAGGSGPPTKGAGGMRETAPLQEGGDAKKREDPEAEETALWASQPAADSGRVDLQEGAEAAERPRDTEGPLTATGGADKASFEGADEPRGDAGGGVAGQQGPGAFPSSECDPPESFTRFLLAVSCPASPVLSSFSAAEAVSSISTAPSCPSCGCEGPFLHRSSSSPSSPFPSSPSCSPPVRSALQATQAAARGGALSRSLARTLYVFVFLHGLAPPGVDSDVTENWGNLIAALLEKFPESDLQTRRAEQPMVLTWAFTYRRETFQSIGACMEALVPALTNELATLLPFFDTVHVTGVGHSMGGLIWRFLLDKKLKDLPLFPSMRPGASRERHARPASVRAPTGAASGPGGARPGRSTREGTWRGPVGDAPQQSPAGRPATCDEAGCEAGEEERGCTPRTAQHCGSFSGTAGEDTRHKKRALACLPFRRQFVSGSRKHACTSAASPPATSGRAPSVLRRHPSQPDTACQPAAEGGSAFPAASSAEAPRPRVSLAWQTPPSGACEGFSGTSERLRPEVFELLENVLNDPKVVLDVFCTLASPHVGAYKSKSFMRAVPRALSFMSCLPVSEIAKEILNADDPQLIRCLVEHERDGQSWLPFQGSDERRRKETRGDLCAEKAEGEEEAARHTHDSLGCDERHSFFCAHQRYERDRRRLNRAGERDGDRRQGERKSTLPRLRKLDTACVCRRRASSRFASRLTHRQALAGRHPGLAPAQHSFAPCVARRECRRRACRLRGVRTHPASVPPVLPLEASARFRSSAFFAGKPPGSTSGAAAAAVSPCPSGAHGCPHISVSAASSGANEEAEKTPRKTFRWVLFYGVLGTDWLVSANSALGTSLNLRLTSTGEEALRHPMRPIELSAESADAAGLSRRREPWSSGAAGAEAREDAAAEEGGGRIAAKRKASSCSATKRPRERAREETRRHPGTSLLRRSKWKCSRACSTSSGSSCIFRRIRSRRQRMPR
ncbi:hypothetical protein BESB_051470 [Besnoitia besnoiti]|uniref:Uncharacterized protein n=1 Tax=Besnoitia besnoiti TaxID=94643 RepID=A0A2A9MHS1_BESBE|nr:hypothetical protein BESB_051470 [Besnoitia besnoiti]PFH35496.1 hypothetical protein BESB_051470 [Besnoitia besnoiti]